MKKILLSLLIALCWNAGTAQTKPQKLGPELNSYAFNYWAPFSSIDGNVILFLYDYTDDGQPGVFLTYRDGANWKDPVAVPKRLTSLSYAKAATLSPDGKTIFVTSTKVGQGGYDIFYANISGGSFSELLPLGAPVNSVLHEGSPTLTPDGSTLYFMRCNKMNATSADECKIMMARKDNRGLWAQPTELPSGINAGNSQMPRIHADGQTLLFASNKHMPSMGNHDIFLTRFENGEWSKPVNIEVGNTPDDDLYFSSTYQGSSLLRDWPGENKKRQLVEFTFMALAKPRVCTRVMGVVTGVTDPAKANVNVIDLPSGAILSSTRPDAKGVFTTYVPGGRHTALFVDPPMENMSYALKVYDYRTGRVPLSDRITTNIKVLGPGDVLELEGIRFKPYSSELEKESMPVLQRAAKLVWANAALRFDIEITLFGLLRDSVSSADLTEVVADTVVFEKEFQVDSVTTEMRDSIAIEYSYHNDRTRQQGNAIMKALNGFGAKPDRITFQYRALEEPVADKRRLGITMKVN